LLDASTRLLASVVVMEEIMRIRRTIIIPAIMALSAAGSILSGSAGPTATAQAPAVHVLAAAPNSLYHG
jgi:hypothetical protein